MGLVVVVLEVSVVGVLGKRSGMVGVCVFTPVSLNLCHSSHPTVRLNNTTDNHSCVRVQRVNSPPAGYLLGTVMSSTSAVESLP